MKHLLALITLIIVYFIGKHLWIFFLTVIILTMVTYDLYRPDLRLDITIVIPY